jgi:hypothetical protein
MITNIRIDLDDRQLAALGQLLNGKKTPATRKQVSAWVEKLVANGLEPDRRPTELKSLLCPKCAKPIAVPVPKATEGAKVPEIAKETAAVRKSVVDLVEAFAKFLEVLPK